MSIEDFTTWTAEEEVGGGTATVTDANTITWTGLQRGEDETRIYKDKGVNFFSGDFTHKLEFVTGTAATTTDGAWVFPWVLTNAIDSPNSIELASGDYLGLGFFNNTGDQPFLQLRISDDGTAATDNSSTLAFSTRYFITITRDDDAGANSTGQLVAVICTVNYDGEAGSVAFDTITVDCGVGEQNDYRYIFATVPRGSGSSATQVTSGLVENFDLGLTVTFDVTGTITSSGSIVGTADSTYLHVTATITGSGTMSATAAMGAIVEVIGTITGTGSITSVGTGTATVTSYKPIFKKRLIAIGNNRLYFEDL